MNPPLTSRKMRPPSHRRLRAFAFDPILSHTIETYDINEVTIRLSWEDDLELGPSDEYIEVVDHDPASKAFYAPVDLNHRYLLAQDGLAPSEGNPQFHQQMVYAVARTTIAHFERALGRRVLWSPRRMPKGAKEPYEYVDRLRIYPHALREANAYYSPTKKALLFGYFPASLSNAGQNLPSGVVFTCLSHDIVAHETTHALLDGLHRRFIEPTNLDVLALHEAFADIVALFQHFTYPDVLRHAIARTRGDLERQNMLAGLAYQFGQAIGHYGALRNALGSFDDKTGAWIPANPDPDELRTTTESHARGAILVAAVFEAFLIIYQWRARDLLRIATGGTGVLPPGDIHPDLVERLAQEAAKTARHILHMCIRALDYCPPVDIDFGDYFRALITADADLVTDDRHNYRLAICEAFRRRGIYPRDVRTLATESLLWDEPSDEHQAFYSKVFGEGGSSMRDFAGNWGLNAGRRDIYDKARVVQRQVHRRFRRVRQDMEMDPFLSDDAPLYLDPNALPTYYRPGNKKTGPPALEVHSVRPVRRIGPDGQELVQFVVELTQRRRGYYDPDNQRRADEGDPDLLANPDFVLRGGCTLLVNPDTGEARYCIYKRTHSQHRLERTRTYLVEQGQPSLRTTYFGDPRRIYHASLVGRPDDSGEIAMRAGEPLAMLHRSLDEEEVL